MRWIYNVEHTAEMRNVCKMSIWKDEESGPLTRRSCI